MKHFLLILSILTVFSTFSQKNKYASFELLGSGGFGSFNYEWTKLDYQKFDFNYRVGLSYTPIDSNNGAALIFPLMMYGLYGENQHKIELGIGQTLSVTTRGSFHVRMPINLGYRYEPLDKRYFLRASYTPIISYVLDNQWQHWAGFSFGYKLNK